MQKELYSVVVYPAAQQMARVEKMNDELAGKIGWYHSRNSRAHVTICEFLASPAELAIIAEYIKQFCLSVPKQDVYFPRIYSFHSTCFAAPDDVSKSYFRILLRNFKRSFPLHRKIFGVKFSSGAHISIGRLLDAAQIETAARLFDDRNPDIRFTAEGFVVRKFDAATRQFSDFAGFRFKADSGVWKPDCQLSLF